MSNENGLYATEKQKESVILIGIDIENDSEFAIECLDELEELVNTAGAEVIDKVIQKRQSIHPEFYVGKGKLQEIKQLIIEKEATGVICDDELSSTQLKVLERELDTKIMDRTMLILDIFAQRASSKEGKLQVELAQLNYRAARLTGLGISLSRLGGGIGTRGPGEKKLEIDRRHIKDRVVELEAQLEEIERHRDIIRSGRQKMNSKVVAIVGYTNAGKSTLLNTLTNESVLAEDKLFATLDTVTRKLNLPGGTEILLTDTVGFIRKLPHHLVKAFRSTLEEALYADIILHVVDISNKAHKNHIKVVDETLKFLKVVDKPIIKVFNKIDRSEENIKEINDIENTVYISAKKLIGLEDLKSKIEAVLNQRKQKIKICIPYSEMNMIQYIHGHCEVISQDHTADGTEFEIYTEQESYNRLKKYIAKS